MEKSVFAGRSLLIATKHHKEKVIAPLLEAALGVTCIVPDHFDTDIFGTFTGERERLEAPLDAARKKCDTAHQVFQSTLVLASEGSFGPHHFLPFCSMDEEYLVLKDYEQEREFSVQHITTATNFHGAEVRTWQEVESFANTADFPAHGLILRQSKDSLEHLAKGITDWNRLYDCYQLIANRYGKVYVETDMRALYNPTRQQAIAEATQKLITKLQCKCPQCGSVGFCITNMITGLPCAACSSPTRSVQSYVYQCSVCTFEKIEPTGRSSEEPGYCDVCNP